MYDTPDGFFDGCEKLTQVTFGQDLGSFGKRAFAGCSLRIAIPFQSGAQIRNVNEEAFAGSGITDVDLTVHVSNSLTVEYAAFKDCRELPTAQH